MSYYKNNGLQQTRL